jgi:hypothetical protein
MLASPFGSLIRRLKSIFPVKIKYKIESPRNARKPSATQPDDAVSQVGIGGGVGDVNGVAA